MAGELTRGSIWTVSLGRPDGQEQSGRRYAIIVQADELWPLSTVAVVPTSTSALPATFRPKVEIDGGTTRALCEQIRTVDARRLQQPAGSVTLSELRSVEDALQFVLSL